MSLPACSPTGAVAWSAAISPVAGPVASMSLVTNCLPNVRIDGRPSGPAWQHGERTSIPGTWEESAELLSEPVAASHPATGTLFALLNARRQHTSRYPRPLGYRNTGRADSVSRREGREDLRAGR